MIEAALAALDFRSRDLRIKLERGIAPDIVTAREQFRLSLVELYYLGYWQQRPDLFRNYMRLFRSCRCLDISAPPSRSAPDRTVRYSP
jgi:hypothetical protein